MENLKLIPEEEILVASNNNQVLLTNFRIRNFYKRDGLNLTSIPLNKITSIQLKSKIIYAFAVLALIFFIGGAVALVMEENLGFISGIAWLIATIFMVFFFLKKEKKLFVNSANGSILLDISNMSNSDILDFIDKIEHSRHSYKR